MRSGWNGHGMGSGHVPQRDHVIPHCRSVEGSHAQDPDDRNTDGSAVVHLRHGEGGVPAAPPTSARDAREPEEEAAGQAADPVKPHPLPHSNVFRRCDLLINYIIIWLS